MPFLTENGYRYEPFGLKVGKRGLESCIFLVSDEVRIREPGCTSPSKNSEEYLTGINAEPTA